MAREQAKRIFTISKSFPKEEKYSLTDQIRRSSRAVNAMIAEAWARRRYPRHSSTRLTRPWAKRWKRKRGWITRWTVTTWTETSIAR
jgi:hypothetical protein